MEKCESVQSVVSVAHFRDVWPSLAFGYEPSVKVGVGVFYTPAVGSLVWLSVGAE